MKNIRIIYEKTGRMRFVSHLDMNRFMSRMIHKTNLPIWYTEGFNKHPYITFALPLSLGFESKYEVMDFRILDDELNEKEVFNAFDSVFPPYLKMVDVFEPIMKTSKIAFAQFLVTFDSQSDSLAKALNGFLSRKEIIVSKKSKRGAISEIDIAPKIKSFEVKKGDRVTLLLTLPAGGQDNVNPTALLNAVGAEFELPPYTVCRTALYNAEMEIFR